jgi:hypothetical protein
MKGCDWPEFAKRVEGQKLCDLMTFQGSCWFMHKDWFDFIEGEDEKNYGTMGGEAQEICLKTWLGGGRCVLTRKTWYAHAKKRVSTYGYKKPMDEWKKSRAYVKECWTNDKWHKQTRDFKWLIKHFYPVPTWHFKQSVPVNRKIQDKFGLNIGAKYPRKLKGLNREGLIQLWNELGYKVGAEIGVFRGDFSEMVYQNIPDVKMYLVDPYLVDYEGARIERPQISLHEQRAHESLDQYNPVWVKKKSEEAHFDIPDNSLDFVYIDGNHKYDYVMLDLLLWIRKVRPGGIVAGHDYYESGRSECAAKKAVDDFTNYHRIEPLYLTDTKDWKKRSDRHHSWFFIKG